MADKKKQDEKVELRESFKLYSELAKTYKWMFVFVILIALIYSLSHVVEKYLFKVLIDNGTEFAAGKVNSADFIKIVWIVVAVFFAALIVKTATYWLKIHIMNRLENKIILDLKKKFFDHIVSLPHRFHVSHKTGSLISKLTRGARAVEHITDFFVFSIMPVVAELLIVGSAILYFDVLSAVMVILVAFVFIIFSMALLDKQKDSRIKADEAEDREKAIISDVFTNIDSVKYFGKENRIKALFAKVIQDTSEKFRINWDYYRNLESGQSLIINAGVVLLLYFPFVKFLNGDMGIGTLVFIYTVYFNLAGPLFNFVWGVRRFYESTADLYGLSKYGEEKNEIEDKINAKKMVVKDGRIDFSDVSFAYKDRKIIKDFDLHIKPGEKIALVGHSGSGKTTIVKLLYRFYDVDSGKILIDGINVKDVKQESLRAELSIVPQEAILFDDTIYNNILFSNPSASREQVMRAIRFAQLDKFIRQLPNGEKTIVGERGIKLSGGEKQRVSIARAILADKRILVLDEATSSLDSHTEHEIQRELWELMKGRTTLIIAHRLSTIMHADRIVVMDKGRIAQIGNHKELIRQRGVYKELWGLQKGGYIGE